MQRLDELVEDESISEGVYKELAELVQRAKTTGQDALEQDGEARAMAPLLFAEIGDCFTHHADEGDRGGCWLELDTFEYLGRADGSTKVTKGWILLRLVSDNSRGICQEGSNKYAGCNGGMLDAIGAWPIADFRNYTSSGEFDDLELALPAEMCWGFRRFEREDFDEESDIDVDQEA